MADLTTEEMGRLRVPLASLPGFAPWLQLVWVGDRMCSLACEGIAPDGTVVVSGAVAGVHNHGPPLRAFPASSCLLDLSDPATRDRVARWVAQRMGLECGSTAPGWFYSATCRGWSLLSSVFTVDNSRLYLPSDDRDRDSRDAYAPALASLDPADARLLSDGSRLVDALALALVAQHVGAM